MKHCELIHGIEHQKEINYQLLKKKHISLLVGEVFSIET
jgi:hypothetical protein